MERLFEAAGANAGHEFRDDPYRRRIADLRGLDEQLDSLAQAADARELLCFEAISIYPHALPSPVTEAFAGWHVTWLLDHDRIITGDTAPAELFTANPTSRHQRILHAVYRRMDHSG